MAPRAGFFEGGRPVLPGSQPSPEGYLAFLRDRGGDLFCQVHGQVGQRTGGRALGEFPIHPAGLRADDFGDHNQVPVGFEGAPGDQNFRARHLTEPGGGGSVDRA